MLDFFALFSPGKAVISINSQLIVQKKKYEYFGVFSPNAKGSHLEFGALFLWTFSEVDAGRRGVFRKFLDALLI